MKTYFFRLLIAIDQFLNVLCVPLFNKLFGASSVAFGYPDETISSVLGKMKQKGEGNALSRFVMWFLNKIDKNHVEDSVEEDEGSR